MNQMTASPVLQSLHIPRPEDLAAIELSPARIEASKIVGFTSRDIRSRPFNLLRSQITKRMDARRWKLIGVTSAAPAAGKSFLSLNIAAALSRLSDRSVYLFDFDLRRGSLSRAMGIRGEFGLGDYLEGRVDDLRQIGCRVGAEGFAFFPCYASFEPSAELFVGARFDALVAAMRALPDDAIVLCDLPPAFANDDTIVITQKLDAFMMIVEQGQTTKKQIEGTLNLLQPIPCLGSILNRYEGGWSDPYGYGYGDKYSTYYG